jgi:threonine/homoserine/homoserine lactone efflux protein
MTLYLLQGLTLGFTASVTPGPFLAFMLSQTLANGWRRTIWLALAPFITDGPIIILALLVLSQTPLWFVRLLQIAGGLLLIYLAKGAWDVYRKSTQPVPTPQEGQAVVAKAGFAKAIAMNAVSPGPYLFWGTVGGPLLIESWHKSAGHAGAFVLGFYLTLIGGIIGYVILFAAASSIDPRITRALNFVSALALLLFGLYRLYQGIFNV